MKDERNQLRQELRDAGASTAEIKELLPIASGLSLLKNSLPAVSQPDAKPNRWLRIMKPAALAASGLALGMLLVIVSQAALPTSALYPVQKFSDSVAIRIHPQFRANVMMKRAQQVNQLVADRADSKQVLATLADYTAEANAYRATPHASYATLEFCKTNLRQAAAATTSPSVRQAISSSLQSLETT